LKKDRDKEIEEILKEFWPEAFAVVKENSNPFQKKILRLLQQPLRLDKNNLSIKNDHIRIEGEKLFIK